eukprot:1145020-Pelagomonas_calceolata.AAC.3
MRNSSEVRFVDSPVDAGSKHVQTGASLSGLGTLEREGGGRIQDISQKNFLRAPRRRFHRTHNPLEMVASFPPTPLI